MTKEKELVIPADDARGDDEIPVITPNIGRAPQPVNWMDGDPEQFQAALELRSHNRRLLISWIQSALQDGTDYGRVHFVKKDNCPDGVRCTNDSHFSKPSLWKAGAEKIAGMLGMTATWPDIRSELETVKKGAKIITMRCELLSATGQVVSEGVGARSIDQDYGDPNKALKMAKKSSLIDAVLNAGGLSEVFTQDIEDRAETEQHMPLTDDGIDYLYGTAKDLYGKKAKDVLASLARRKFNISDGNWKMILDHRLGDAVRSLKEKAAAEKDVIDETTEEGTDEIPD